MSFATYKTHNSIAANMARKNGCTPEWSDSMRAYVCGCEDLRHACDQQCSVITIKSAHPKEK